MAHSLADFAADLVKIGVAIDMIGGELLEEACKIVETEAKHVIGTYSAGYNWPQLAWSTQIDRDLHGFPMNEPLLRTGELRDSIQHTVQREWREWTGWVGSNSQIAVYQELGTSRIPPRSFLGGAATAKEREIVEMICKGAHKRFLGVLAA